MFNNLHEECGVFGIFEPKTSYVAQSVYLALYALQHRGQESCGIAVNDDGVFTHHKGNGLVPDVFTQDKLEHLGMGNIAIGHVRYSTTGGKNINNVQPLVIRHIKGNLALAHNGNLVNAMEIRKSFELNGGIFHGTSDTESIAYEIVSNRLSCKSTEEAIKKAMPNLKGAYSCVVMTATKLIAFRDPNGFRPLCFGKTADGAICVSSESCALDTVGAKIIRDVLPGEIITIDSNGIHSDKTHCKNNGNLCVFEYIYFARPDSIIDGASVEHARMKAGAFLAKESPVDADIVIGVPDSGLDAALGYANESGIPYGIGFIKNRYIGRSFIQPNQSQREDAVRIKLNVIKEKDVNRAILVPKGRDIVVLDVVDVFVQVFFGGQIADCKRRILASQFVADCLHEMCFSESGAAMYEQGIVSALAWILDNSHRCCERKAVGRTANELFERIFVVKRHRRDEHRRAH